MKASKILPFLCLLVLMTNSLITADHLGEWLVFNASNSPLTSDAINTFYFETDGTTLIGYGKSGFYANDGGLVILKNNNWQVYTHVQLGWGNHLISAITLGETKDDIYLGLDDPNVGGGGVIKKLGEDWVSIIQGEGDMNTVRFLSKDNTDKIWVGYYSYQRYTTTYSKGLSLIEGSQITNIYGINGLESNVFTSCAIFEDEVWISAEMQYQYIYVFEGGLAKFNNSIWTVYNDENSEIGTKEVLDVKIDVLGNIWLGTANGLKKFDREDWISIDTSNSAIPVNTISNLAIDKNNNIWFSNEWWTGIGLVKYDGTNFEIYDTLNSPLPSNSINDIEIDNNNNIWIATNKGFAIFNEVKINNLVEKLLGLKEYKLNQNYPNPFNPSTKISWQSPVSSYQTIKVFDVLGREVATLVNEEKPAGEYEVEFTTANLPSGIYFYQLRATPIGGQAGNYVETKKMVLIR
jgi:hypothetical protein